MSFSRSQKMIAAAIGGLLLLLLLLSQMLSSMVDVDAALNPLRQHVKELTGQPLVTEEFEVGIFPTPHITIYGVAIRNVTEAKEPYLLFADRLRISMSLVEMVFEDNPPVRGIELSGLRLYFERDPRGHRNWGFVDEMRQKAGHFDGLSIRFDNASFAFVDRQTDFKTEVKQASGELALSQTNTELAMTGELMRQPVQLNGSCQIAHFNHFNSFDADCRGAMQSDGLSLDVKNRVVMHDGSMQTRGTLELDTQDIRIWSDAFFSQQAQAMQNYMSEALPVKATLETYTDQTRLVMNMTQFDMAQTSGKGSVQLSRQDAKNPQLSVKAAFDRLDFDGIKALIAQTSGGRHDLLALKDGFARGHTGAVDVSVSQLDYNQIDVTNFRLKGDLAGGEVVVREARGKLPSNANFVTLGRVSSSASGVQYQGVVEASGENLADLVPMMDIPTTGALRVAFPQYRARLNATVNAQETILSEIRILTGERVRIAGGLNVKNDEAGTVNGTLSIENLDVTPLVEAWRGDHSLLEDPGKTLSHDHPFSFAWLKQFDRKMALKLRFASLGYEDFEGNHATFDLHIAPNELMIDTLQMQLGDSAIHGDVSLVHQPNQTRPFIRTKLDISKMRLGNALRDALWLPEDGRTLTTDNSVWSKQPLNFHPLRYFNGQHEVSIGSLTHDVFEAQNVRLEWQLMDEKLEANKVSMAIWGGRLSAPFELDVTTLPRFSTKFVAENASLNQLLASWVDFTNINGRVSLNGNVRASGVNFSDWVNSMKGAVSFDARTVIVRAFNLPGIVRSVKALRNVSGLSNSIRSGFESGTSRFNRVNGVMVLENGGLSITNLGLTALEAAGRMDGRFDIRQWQTDLDLRLRLTGLQVGNPPDLLLHFDGPIGQPNRQMNLKSIESYIAKKQ